MSFPTEEQLKYARKMEDSYNEVIPDGLDQATQTRGPRAACGPREGSMRPFSNF